ncbi:hypothetical protein AU381_26120 [Sinorhizobium glycinis]|uniref:Uncharacterized protein n=1 Tax=Sinorhizobium glycinis TaxID=1472378 RepID=A0A178XIZ6_9HYPH|nr:hypothetical protein AU381_26120 [Sinorhizobium glycinis]
MRSEVAGLIRKVSGQPSGESSETRNVRQSRRKRLLIRDRRDANNPASAEAVLIGIVAAVALAAYWVCRFG